MTTNLQIESLYGYLTMDEIQYSMPDGRIMLTSLFREYNKTGIELRSWCAMPAVIISFETS